MQRWVANQISQANERSVGCRLLHLNLCLIRTFLQFLCILYSCVVLLHCFFLELVRATHQGEVVVQSVVVEDFRYVGFAVGVVGLLALATLTRKIWLGTMSCTAATGTCEDGHQSIEPEKFDKIKLCSFVRDLQHDIPSSFP